MEKIRSYAESKEKLLRHCEEALAMPSPVLRVFFNGPEREWIHYVPRLHVCLEGVIHYTSYEGGELGTAILAGGTLGYSSRHSLLQGQGATSPHRVLSFSFFPHYIRAMHLNRMRKPEESIYFHTDKPLSQAGQSLIQTMDALAAEGRGEQAKAFLPLLLELATETVRGSGLTDVHHDVRLWEAINLYMREHRCERLSRQDIASRFRISASYVSIVFQRYCDKSFVALKRQYALEHALQLLLASHKSIEEIAQESGFTGANYFVRCFRQAYGMPPNAFRNHRPPLEEGGVRR